MLTHFFMIPNALNNVIKLNLIVKCHLVMEGILKWQTGILSHVSGLQTKLSLTGITMQPNTDVGRRHQSPAKPLLFLMPQIY